MNKAQKATPRRQSVPWRVIDRIERQDAMAGNDYLEGHFRGRVELGNGGAIEVGLSSTPLEGYQPQFAFSIDDEAGSCVGDAYLLNVTPDDLAALAACLTELAARARAGLPAMVELMRREEAASAAAVGKYETYDEATHGGVLV